MSTRYNALDAVHTCSWYGLLIAIIAQVAELNCFRNSYVIVLLSNRSCWVLNRYIVLFMSVPAEMKVIKSHASRSKLIAARVRKHFFIFAQSTMYIVGFFC